MLIPSDIHADIEPLDALIYGNHDKVAAGVEDPLYFNEVAAETTRWTYKTLTEANRRFLAELAEGPIQVGEAIEIFHGTPYDEDVYMFDENETLRSLASAAARICFFGHTHLQWPLRLRPRYFGSK